ncbi:MAG: CHC2 zinc finger domain-containing protein [Acidobacteriota bacterium]|nr:CHC2 zinc finger domain-containing protein [Acidobacteriota bacterium]
MSKAEIERIRRGHDLVAEIRRRGVALTRKGRNWVGLCPFHDDREPSLVVNPDKQLWNCFGACRTNGGKSGGDVFAFVARMEGITFLEALKRLGYEEPDPPARAGRRSRPTSVSEPVPAIVPADPALLGRVAAHYHRVFRERPEGQDYLKSRGLDDPEMLAAFEVGYVDGTLRATFAAEGDTAEALKAAGIVRPRPRTFPGLRRRAADASRRRRGRLLRPAREARPASLPARSAPRGLSLAGFQGLGEGDSHRVGARRADAMACRPPQRLLHLRHARLHRGPRRAARALPRQAGAAVAGQRRGRQPGDAGDR